MSQSFAVVIEQSEGYFSAYVPDLRGCIATGASREEVLQHIRESIAVHFDGIAADGERPPVQSSSVATVQL